MKLLAFTALAALFAATVPAEAAVYYFSQGGYTDGASVFGSFTGSDLDGDGFIDASVGEVTDFTASFSGNTVVSAFTIDYSNLVGGTLVYDLSGGLGYAGDDSLLVLSDDNAYTVGLQLCDGVNICSAVGDLNTYVFDSSPEGLKVTAVPEPAAWAMMLVGFGAVGVVARRRRNVRVHFRLTV